MKLSVCFEESSCILDLDIFKEKRLPKNVCDFAAAAKIQSKRSYDRKSHCFYTWMLGSSSDIFKKYLLFIPIVDVKIQWLPYHTKIEILILWCLGFFTDFSFANWKDLLPDNPGEILLTAASDQLMEHLGLAGYLKKEQCSATSTASTVKGWNDGNSAVICSSNFEAIQWNLWFIVIFCMVNCTF